MNEALIDMGCCVFSGEKLPALAGFFLVRRACVTARGCKSPVQPDGGEGLAKRKGVVARRGLKEARSKATT
jgi:hypothetical protein